MNKPFEQTANKTKQHMQNILMVTSTKSHKICVRSGESPAAPHGTAQDKFMLCHVPEKEPYSGHCKMSKPQPQFSNMASDASLKRNKTNQNDLTSTACELASWSSLLLNKFTP